MFALLLSLVVLGLILLIITHFQRKNKTEEIEINIQTNDECCGAHEVCEQDSLLNSDNKIAYFDDEELDALANIPPSEFTPEQIIQLSEVFFTLKESDVAGWLRSLQLRRIQLPVELREQALLIVSERRTAV
ncbi:MAG: phospholipase [Paludibacter sp.]|nr:phospholipase [Paludibacter sp.]